jgi:ArsR family transcriptional regulator
MMLTRSNVRADQMFKALSDRTRLRILHLLRPGERCVCDIVDVLGLSQPKISRHLAYLRKAGLVVSRREGHWSYYQLAAARTKFHAKLLACLNESSSHIPETARDTSKLAQLADNRCC